MEDLLSKERERAYYEKVHKKLNVQQMQEERRKKREERGFSHKMMASLNMLTKVSVGAFRRKDHKDEVKDKQSHHKSRLETHLNSTQQVLKKVDLSNSFHLEMSKST